MSWEYTALALYAKRLAVAHAPAGGVTLQGEQFEGGQFIPGVSQATVDKAAAQQGTEPQKKHGKIATATPEFKVWFGKSKIVNPDGSPRVVYHGTRSTFSEFKRPAEMTGLINHFLGAHFAVDPSVTEAFTIGQYARNTTAWAATPENQLIERENEYGGKERINPGGRTIPVYLSIENPYKIDPRKESNRMDQTAIAIEAAGTVFREDKDYFIAYAMHLRQLTRNHAEQAYRILKSNQPIEKDEYPSLWTVAVPQDYIDENDGDGFKAFVANYGAEFGPNIQGEQWSKRIAAKFVNILKSRGYDGIQYENTSDNEVKEGADPTVYIPFDSTQIKSATGNRGTFDKNNPDIRMAVAHAPKGGVTLKGKFYAGGKFIPGVSQSDVDEAAQDQAASYTHGRGFDSETGEPKYAHAPATMDIGGIPVQSGRLIPLQALHAATSEELRTLGFPDMVAKIRDYRDNGVRSETFKSWFGDWENRPESASKVLEDSGEPKIVYHGTRGGEWRDIDVDRAELGFHVGTVEQSDLFTRDEGGRIMPLYVSIRNPLRLRDNGIWTFDKIVSQIQDYGIEIPASAFEERKKFGKYPVSDDYRKWSNEVLRKAITNAGYDGVVYLNRTEGVDFKAIGGSGVDIPDSVLIKHGASDSWIAFSATQIKSATGNRGTFDPDNPDIRMSLFRLAVAHAPAGGVTIQGKFFEGGQFIPGDVLDNALRDEEITEEEHKEWSRQYKSDPGQMELPFSEGPAKELRVSITSEGIDDRDRAKELIENARKVFDYKFQKITTGSAADRPEEKDGETKSAEQTNKILVARALTDALIDDKEFVDFCVSQWTAHTTDIIVPSTTGLVGEYKQQLERTMAVRGVVQSLVDTWAQSSSDSNRTSMLMQRAAIEEFGLPRDAYDSAINKAGKSFASTIESNYETAGKHVQKFLRAMYNNTQQHLKNVGVRSVLLCRGMHFSRLSDFVEEAETNEYSEIEFHSNPLSSWSSSKETAVSFANSDDDPIRVLSYAEVPASRILSVPLTGLGCSHEFEFVIIGGLGTAATYIGESEYDPSDWYPVTKSAEEIEFVPESIEIEPTKVEDGGEVYWTYEFGSDKTLKYKTAPEEYESETYTDDPGPITVWYYDEGPNEDQMFADDPGTKSYWKFEDDDELYEDEPEPMEVEGLYTDGYGTEKSSDELEELKNIYFPDPWD